MNDGVKRDVRSIAGATVFIVVGAFALYYSAYFSPLGSVFPRVVAVFMIVLSLVYVGVAMMRPGSAPQNPERGSTPRRALRRSSRPLRRTSIAAATKHRSRSSTWVRAPAPTFAISRRS